jgi:hypothetical protein
MSQESDEIKDVEVCCNVMLRRTEVPCAHYLVENKFPWRPTHVLSNAKPSMSILVISPTCKQTREN